MDWYLDSALAPVGKLVPVRFDANHGSNNLISTK